MVNSLLAGEHWQGLLYIVSYGGLVVSALLGAITIYLSCYFVARRASKMSPIEGIRNSEDIKLDSKKMKTPKLIKMLFKTGGVIAYKNLKRNKKKYRVTVISMVISVVMFMVTTSFVGYILYESGDRFTEERYNISIRIRSSVRILPSV